MGFLFQEIWYFERFPKKIDKNIFVLFLKTKLSEINFEKINFILQTTYVLSILIWVGIFKNMKRFSNITHSSYLPNKTFYFAPECCRLAKKSALKCLLVRLDNNCIDLERVAIFFCFNTLVLLSSYWVLC